MKAILRRPIPSIIEKEQLLSQMVSANRYVIVDCQPGIRFGVLCRAIVAGKVLYLPVEEGCGTFPFSLDRIISISERFPDQPAIIVLKPTEEED